MLEPRRAVKALLATWMVVNKASFNRRSLRYRRRVARHVVAKREWERLFSGERLGWLAERCPPGAPGAGALLPGARTTAGLTAVPVADGSTLAQRSADNCRDLWHGDTSPRRGSRAGRGEKAQAGRRPPPSPATAAPLPCLRRLPLRPPEVRSRSGRAGTRRVRGSRAKQQLLPLAEARYV